MISICRGTAMTLVAASALAACGSGPVRSADAGRLRTQLAALQSDPQLASRAPIAIKDADAAVTAAEQPQSNPALSAHLDYIADRKVKLARALAEARYADDQLRALQQPAVPVPSEAPAPAAAAPGVDPAPLAPPASPPATPN